MAENSIAEELVMALGEALVRKGLLDLDDIVQSAERVQKSGSSRSIEVAHALHCIAICAAAPETSEWLAEQRRSQMHVVKAPE